MMHMTFYWSKKVTLLFDFWKTDSWTSYSLSLLACLLVSAFYQYLENRRLRLKAITFETPSSTTPQNQIPLLRQNLTGDKAKLGVRFAGALLFGFNSVVGYLLMLAVMSFNGGVLVAIVVGLAIGYFFFRSEGDEGTVLVADSACACA
ncbi:copper transporter 5-like [Neltuma alba]|uniref:copper transporter 5-like n=1 Tax=Neltuma alba TaxID=207710 RepID=UPI0010A47AB9|nr:copper transporter 5-like [Prosopis alba]XP_028807086.1 copper transporter 5-like [Prosopis alba]